MKIVAETVMANTTHEALVGALEMLGFTKSASNIKTNWRGESLVVEQIFTTNGATITLTLDTNEPTPVT